MEASQRVIASTPVDDRTYLIVPSVAFLDQRERWNLVVFADRLDGLERLIAEPRRLASFRPIDASR